MEKQHPVTPVTSGKDHHPQGTRPLTAHPSEIACLRERIAHEHELPPGRSMRLHYHIKKGHFVSRCIENRTMIREEDILAFIQQKTAGHCARRRKSRLNRRVEKTERKIHLALFSPAAFLSPCNGKCALPANTAGSARGHRR